MSQTVLVTGACGFTGSNMIEYLDEEWSDAEIIATDLPGSDRGEYYVEAPDSKDPQPVYYEDILDEYDVEFVPGDLTNPEDVEQIAGAASYDTVFHIASLFDYFAPREALYTVNVEGTRNLLAELAKQDSPRVIHWSTLGVLGDAGYETPKTEESAYNPHNRYCESKVSQEQVVRAYDDRLDISILRPAPIYGPRHHYGIFHILSIVERWGFVPVTKLYPREKQRQFPCVHVADVVGAAAFMAETPDTIDETYNVLSDSMSQEKILHFIGEEMELPIIDIPAPYRAFTVFAKALYTGSVRLEKWARDHDTRPPVDAPMLRYLTANMWFSNQKMKDAGYEFKYEDARDGLGEYIEWCLEHDYLKTPAERDSRRENIVTSVQSKIPGK